MDWVTRQWPSGHRKEEGFEGPHFPFDGIFLWRVGVPLIKGS